MSKRFRGMSSKEYLGPSIEMVDSSRGLTTRFMFTTMTNLYEEPNVIKRQTEVVWTPNEDERGASNEEADKLFIPTKFRATNSSVITEVHPWSEGSSSP